MPWPRSFPKGCDRCGPNYYSSNRPNWLAGFCASRAWCMVSIYGDVGAESQGVERRRKGSKVSRDASENHYPFFPKKTLWSDLLVSFVIWWSNKSVDLEIGPVILPKKKSGFWWFLINSIHFFPANSQPPGHMSFLLEPAVPSKKHQAHCTIRCRTWEKKTDCASVQKIVLVVFLDLRVTGQPVFFKKWKSWY